MIISKTPLRISLCGGGTDMPYFYNQYTGRVISCAINKYVYVVIKKRFDNLIVLNYTKHEIVNSVKEIKHDLIREVMLLYGIENGVEITTLADIPSEGSGLGSSSAVLVGLLNVMASYVNYPTTPDVLAQQACNIEVDVLQRPIGKQDQYISAYGGLKLFTFCENGVAIDSYKLTPQELNTISSNLFLHYTGITRDSNAILWEQKTNKEDNIGSLKFLNQLTTRLDKSIRCKDFGQIGDVLMENWNIKKRLTNGITNQAIDTMVVKSFAGGATGCKISGAGGGGFLLSYVPKNRQSYFTDAMSEYRELPFNIDTYGSRIIFNIQ